MRIYEFADTNVELDKFITLLRNQIGRAASKKTPASFNWAAIQKIADKVGFELAADYETFKAIYDSSPALQNIVANFNDKGIELNVPGTDKDTQTPVKQGQTSQDAVDKMAASAAPQQLAAQT